MPLNEKCSEVVLKLKQKSPVTCVAYFEPIYILMLSATRTYETFCFRKHVIVGNIINIDII